MVRFPNPHCHTQISVVVLTDHQVFPRHTSLGQVVKKLSLSCMERLTYQRCLMEAPLYPLLLRGYTLFQLDSVSD